jgi:hypothetical protein
VPFPRGRERRRENSLLVVLMATMNKKKKEKKNMEKEKEKEKEQGNYHRSGLSQPSQQARYGMNKRHSGGNSAEKRGSTK